MDKSELQNLYHIPVTLCVEKLEEEVELTLKAIQNYRSLEAEDVKTIPVLEEYRKRIERGDPNALIGAVDEEKRMSGKYTEMTEILVLRITSLSEVLPILKERLLDLERLNRESISG